MSGMGRDGRMSWNNLLPLRFHIGGQLSSARAEDEAGRPVFSRAKHDDMLLRC